MNHIEVELKLAAQSSAIDAVRQCISTLSPQHSAPRKLTNIYFDTAQRQLRQWDMGLRIRGCDGRYEMTMKTAGQVISGLHQRPEFNVEIDSLKSISRHFQLKSGQKERISRNLRMSWKFCLVPISLAKHG